MFRDRIDKPIDPIPRGYANSLKRIHNEPDYSLTCVSIAMLKPRIDGYNGIDGGYFTFDDKATCVSDFIDRVRNIGEYPLFCYYTYNYDRGNIDEIKEKFPEFKERNNIKSFIKDKADCECTVLYHETMNVVGIFVNSRDFRLYHLLLSFMSLYYPSLFKDKPMTKDDYELAKSLTNKEKTKFYECIKVLVKPYTIEFRRRQLSSLMKTIHEAKINSAKINVDHKRSQIRQYEEQYGNLVQQLKDLIVIYEGLVATEKYDDPEEELVEYLANNTNIHDLNIEGNQLYFSVTTLLNNYNEQAWKTFSERGFIYDGEYGAVLPEVFRSTSNRKLLFDNIFSEDPTLMVKMAGNYQLDLDRCRVYTHSGYNYVNADPEFKSYVPNPHLKIFECLGGYKDRVMPALRERNYISAVEICIASAGSVNLDETQQTFRPFLGWILANTESILRRKEDNVDMTPEEALVWLKDKAKEE